MYQINDNNAAIKLLQRYLGGIYEGSVIINQTGVFDENTAAALNAFQTQNSFKIKPYADREVYESIYNEYLRSLRKKAAEKAAPDIFFPAKRGSRSLSIGIVNSMLNDLLKFYSIFDFSPQGEYFTSETERAIKEIGKIFETDTDGTLDEELYLRITDEWKSISANNAD